MVPVQALGDVWVLVQIATTVVQKLHAAATTAPKEVRELIDNTKYLESTLKHTKAALEEHGAILRSQDDVQEGLLIVLRNCGETLGDLKKVVKEYEKIVSEDGTTATATVEKRRKQWADAFKTGYCRIKWTTMDGTIDHIRKLMGQHFTALQLTISNLNLHKLSELRVLLVAKNDQANEMYKSIKEHGWKIDQILLNLPALAAFSPALASRDSGYGSTPSSNCGSVIMPSSHSFSSPTPFRMERSPQNITNPPQSPAVSPSSGPILTPSSPPISEKAPTPLFEVKLPGPLIPVDTDWDFPQEPDLRLLARIPGSPAEKLPFATRASIDEQGSFISSVIDGRRFDRIPVVSVRFVWRPHPGSATKSLISASTDGDLFIIREGSGGLDIATSIWIFNDERTVRIQQKLPAWDVTLPYTIHGRPKSAIIDQGYGLSFFKPNPNLRDSNAVGATSVTYDFMSPNHCDTFQERLYGWKLVCTIPVDGVFRTKKVGDDEPLVGQENIRIWKDDSGDQVKFMARLRPVQGWEKYLVFDLKSESLDVEAKGQNEIRINGMGAQIEKQTAISRRSSSKSSISTFSLASFKGSKAQPQLVEKITIKFSGESKKDKKIAQDNFHQEVLNCRCRSDVDR